MRPIIIFLTVAFISISATGQITFKKIIPSDQWKFGCSIIQTYDEGYAVCGLTPNDYTQPQLFGYLVKTDKYGDSIWGKIYQHVYFQQAYSIVQIDDNGYVLGGFLDSLGNSLNSHGYIIRTNDIGDTVWTYASSFNNENHFRSVHKALSGGFIAGGGETSDYIGNILLEKISSSGELEWRKTFADTSYDGARSVRSTTDGGIILCSNITPNFPGDRKIVIIKMRS